jgi:hypothetical protein
MEEASVAGVDIRAFSGGNVESRYPRSGYKIRVIISGQTFFNARAKSASVPGFALSKREKQMKQRRLSALCISTVLPLMLYGAAASGKSEVKGAAILDHPCGKVAVKQMGLTHAGKMEEQWKSMPAKDRTMMSGMMKEMSQTEEQYSAAIKANGLLVVDGPSATLTVKKTTKDKSGSSTETMTQNFKIDGSQCLVSR